MLEDKYVNGRGRGSGRADALLVSDKSLMRSRRYIGLVLAITSTMAIGGCPFCPLLRKETDLIS
jgi:hypothetical protein